MKNLKRFSVFLLAICMLFSVTSVFASAEGYDFTFEIQGHEVYSEIYDVLELVNEYRADEGLPALTLDAELTAAAMQRAAECAIFFDHTRPNGESCFTVFPDRLGGRRAENIAIGQRNAASVMNSWMNSSGHHANIMNSSSRSIGIGCFYCNGTYSWVQLFSSTTAIPPSSTLQNREATPTIEAVGGTLGLGCALEETGTPNHFELCVYNRNVEFEYIGYIRLYSDNIYFTSSNSNVCRITNKTHLEYTGEGTAIISGYFGSTLFFQTEHEVGDPSPHEHSYTSVVTPPTCTSNGYTTYTCSCGDSYTGNTVNALGHSYSSVVTAPTCTTDGFTTHTCINCGNSYTNDRVNALGHNYSSVITPPTYTEEGFTTYTCTECGDSYVSDRVNPLGHNYSSVVTPPTCTTGGYTTYTCTECGDSYVSDRVNPLGHSYSSVVTAPTCTSGGYTTYTCRNCGDSYTGNTVNALGHSYSSVVTAPTCTSGGYTTYTCRNCGDSYTANQTAPVAHDYTVTATPYGYLYDCKNCNHYYFEEISTPDSLMGDANSDGTVTNADIVLMARYVVGLVADLNLTAADINADGDVTNSDIIEVARYIVGLE